MNYKVRTSIIILFIASLVGLSACKKPSEPLEAKQKQLAELHKQLKEIKAKINKLKAEIEAEKGEASDDGAVAVAVQTVTKRTFERYINVQGRIESDRVSMLSSKMGGNIVNIFVNEGDMVKKGQLLIEIDDDMLQSRLEEINTRLEFVKDVYERQKRLWEQQAGSEIQYLQAKNNYEAMLKSKETLEKQIKDTKIYASFSGYVDYIFVKVGEMLMPGMPAIKLADMRDPRVIADISESYIATVRKGIPAIVTFTDINQKIEGRVIAVSKSIDVKKRMFRAEIKLKRIPKNIKPYQICGVAIKDIVKHDVVTVPLAYVQTSGKRYFVYVCNLDNMTAEKRFIETGMTNQTEVEVLSGLQPEEIIITDGTFDVADGQKIKIVANK